MNKNNRWASNNKYFDCPTQEWLMVDTSLTIDLTVI